jgi:hypothetical protein
MTVTFLKSIPFTICQSPFLFKLTTTGGSLPQRIQLDDFISSNCIQDFSLTDITAPHDGIGLVINKYHSLDELKNKIISSSYCAKTYLYIAINKFYIYSTVDHPDLQSDNYDLNLIEYCRTLISDQFVLLKYTSPYDNGVLGNFLHPVTTMFFKRYA